MRIVKGICGGFCKSIAGREASGDCLRQALKASSGVYVEFIGGMCFRIALLVLCVWFLVVLPHALSNFPCGEKTEQADEIEKKNGNAHRFVAASNKPGAIEVVRELF